MCSLVPDRFQKLAAGNEPTTTVSEFFQSTDQPGVLNVNHTWLDKVPVRDHSSPAPGARAGSNHGFGPASKRGPGSGRGQRALSAGRRRHAAPIASPPRSGRGNRGATTTTESLQVTASNHSDATDAAMDEETGASTLSL
ncbi:uncharacterized protein LOC144146864 [Haemaphysalis longicornis]